MFTDTMQAPNPRIRSNARQVSELFRDALLPVWPPLQAPLVRTAHHADATTFYLQFFRWELKIEVAPRAASLPAYDLHREDASDVMVRAYIRPAGLAMKPLNMARGGGWRLFARRTLSDPAAPPQVEKALWWIQDHLTALPGVNEYLNGLRR